VVGVDVCGDSALFVLVDGALSVFVKFTTFLVGRSFILWTSSPFESFLSVSFGTVANAAVKSLLLGCFDGTVIGGGGGRGSSSTFGSDFNRTFV
jgi:hypothetical protein